jgi:hypothetical protein
MTNENRGKRLEIPTGAVYALLAAISLICITVLAVAIAGDNDGGKDLGPAPREELSHLYIEDVYFKTYEPTTYTLQVTVYITNDGTKDAANVQAHIWPVVQESNIAMDMEEMDFGDIYVNETKMADQVINLKAGTLHSVEILIFDSDKLVVKGRASVSTDGNGGAQYNTVEVKGTVGDNDYDGLPDAWENHYGLDPTDPSDARGDEDHDGITNLDEYKLNRDPTLTPAEEEDAKDTGSGSGLTGLFDKESDEDGSPAIIGAGLILVLVVGVFIALIAGAVISRRKMEKRNEFFVDERKPEPQTPQRRGPPTPGFDVEVRDGHNDEDDDLPRGRGIYE